MSIRKTLNENRTTVAIAVAVVVVLAIVWLWRSGSSTGMPDSKPQPQAFYSADDGLTWFTDVRARITMDKPAPNGQVPVLAYVYRYENEKPFVGWLEDYTPRGKEMVRAFYDDPANAHAEPPDTQEMRNERLVKKPGGSRWVNVGTNAAEALAVRSMERKSGDLPRLLDVGQDK